MPTTLSPIRPIYGPPSPTIRLYGSTDKFENPIRAALFGEMIRRAGHIEMYQSDLYHDAHWLDRNLHGVGSFYWGPRSWGSFIGTDPTFIASGGMPEGLWLYRIDITEERGTWFATFTVIDPAETQPIGVLS